MLQYLLRESQHKQAEKPSGCRLMSLQHSPCPCTEVDGKDPNSPSHCLTFSCRRTRSIKNFQQASLESTRPWPLTSFLTLLMMFSTSSSGKRSGISPMRRGYNLVCWPAFCCCLRAKWNRCLPSHRKAIATGTQEPQQQGGGTEGHSAKK